MSSPLRAAFPARPTALFLGHPGHELRVYGWMRMAHPIVSVLTDGSGGTGASRLDRTAHLLSRIGARPGTFYGRLTDREIYRAMIDGQASRFIEMVEELARSWEEDGIEVVASDANEGYSPTHDLCCVMAQAAAELVNIETGRQIKLYTFCLTEWETPRTSDFSSDILHVRLDDEVRDEKIAEAKSYIELTEEVDRALAYKGAEYFRDEYLFAVADYTDKDATYKPYYEKFGEQRVAEGRYTEVLRYGQHVLPIFRALRKFVAYRAVPLTAAGR